MELKNLIEKVNRRIGIGCAWFVTLIGLFAVISWQVGLYFFSTIPYFEWPLTYPSSICLLLSGLSFLNFIYPTRIPLYRWCAILLFVLSGLQLLELSFHVNLGVSAVLIRTLIHTPKELSNPFFVETINFLLISLSLLCWSRQKRTVGRSNFSIFCCLLVLFSAVAILFLYAGPLNYLNQSISMRFFTAGSQIVLALGLTCWNYYLDTAQKIKTSKWLFILVMGGALLFYLFLINQIFSVFTSIVGIIGTILVGAAIYIFQLVQKRAFLQKEVQKLLRVSEGIVKMMDETETVPEACKKLLQILNETHGWQLLIYWVWNDRKKVLQLIEYVNLPGYSFPNFEDASRKLIVSEESFVSKVFINKRPLWFKDFSKDALSLALTAKEDLIKGAPTLPVYGKALSRVTAAEKDAIKGALALPVYDGQKLIGILELFETEILAIKPDDTWLTFMRSIGTEFSLFIERKEAENIRKELANIVDSSIDAIYTIDPELNIVSWNKAAEILYGWKEEEIKEHNVLELYPAGRIEESERLRKIFKEKKVYEHYETQRLRKDKTLIWVTLIYSPVLTATGEMIVISQDITKQKEAYLALQQNEEKLRSVIEMTDILIWEMDLYGKYTYSNQLAKKITGFDPNELTGKEMAELANHKQIKKEIEECIANKRGWKGRIWEIKHKDGSTIWLESNGNPILDEEGKLIGFRGGDRNITEQVNMELAKDEFISMVSHELRTPLTSIIAALGLLEAKEDAPLETKELLKLADRNAERLAHIINDILDVEKLQLSKMHLELKPILLVNVIQEAINVMQSSFATDQITLVVGDMFPSVEIIADYNRLLQVLLNFLSNAIKFSSAGGKVMVSMEMKGERVRVLMKDWGSGIPSAIQGKIFEKFIQAEGGDMRLKGTGLGLNISKSIVQQMGGTIGFVSEPSKGSTFYFEFPIIKQG